MLNYNKIKKIADDINTITIQGATNIAREGFDIMKREILVNKFKSQEELQDFVKKGSQLLSLARDTEPMLFNGLKYCQNILNKCVENKKKLKDIQEEVASSFDKFIDILHNENKKRSEIGANLIDDKDNILTHCHSSSAINILKKARKDGKKIHVYDTETRPLYQGRQTSKDLLKAGIPTTMLTDGSASFFVDNLYESDIHINKVILGCDAIRLNGDVINKVGSFGIGLSARHSGIPVYIAGSLLKIDTSGAIEIEERSGEEVWPDAPKDLEIVNYAFDLIPAKCIRGIITEFGVIEPRNLEKELKKHYPRI